MAVMDNSPNPLRITRSELYERAWTTPIIRLAEEFGITNFLLAGICRNHQIPTPPAGHWSKVAHGKPMYRPPLAGDGGLLIDIGQLKTPGYRASKPMKRHKPTDQTEPPRPSEATPVSHAKAMKTVARLRAGKGDGLVRVAGAGCFKVTASVAMAERVALVLDHLLVKVEGQGWRVKASEQRLELDINGEAIGFELVELTDRVVHKITESERAAQEKYRARIAQARKTGAYVSPWDAPKIADWDYIPNGKLSLVLDETASYRGVRRTFSDRKTQRVETLIDYVIKALAGFEAETKRRRIEAEAARMQAEEDGRRREALKQLAVIEARRVDFADRQIVRLERVDRMIRLLAHLGDGDLPSDTDRFRDWLKRYVGLLQADLGTDRIETRLASTRLMYDDAVTHAWIDVETGNHRSSV